MLLHAPALKRCRLAQLLLCAGMSSHGLSCLPPSLSIQRLCFCTNAGRFFPPSLSHVQPLISPLIQASKPNVLPSFHPSCLPPAISLPHLTSRAWCSALQTRPLSQAPCSARWAACAPCTTSCGCTRSSTCLKCLRLVQTRTFQLPLPASPSASYAN
jgi:hypothetical protein